MIKTFVLNEKKSFYYVKIVTVKANFTEIVL